MPNEQPPAKIREIALALDNAIENKNITAILSSFTNNCEIELSRQQLVGKEGVQKWIDWLYRNFRQIKFQPVILMVEGNILFEEFIVRARLHNGLEIKSKQSEVLVFEGDKIKSLRLYFDRLDFTEMVARGPLNKTVINQVIKKSLKGLD